MPHHPCILHKVGDSARDSDDAEKCNADARDDEGEHDGGAEGKLKLGHTCAGCCFVVLVGVLSSPGMHRHSPFQTSVLSHGGVVIGPFKARFSFEDITIMPS